MKRNAGLAWRVEVTRAAEKQLASLGTTEARRIVSFLRTRVSGNPRAEGKALSGPLGDLWRYRVGDYRIVCELRDDVLTVLMIRIAHRREVYR